MGCAARCRPGSRRTWNSASRASARSRCATSGSNCATRSSPGTCWARKPAAGGTARYVDSSVERVQARVTGWVRGTLRAGLQRRRRAAARRPSAPANTSPACASRPGTRPPRCTRPSAPQTPLVFDVFDRWTGRSLGGLTHHVAHPGGRNYDTYPVNANEAEARRRARFFPFGHTPGPMAPPRRRQTRRSNCRCTPRPGSAGHGSTPLDAVSRRSTRWSTARGGVRPHWRTLLGAFAALGEGVLARARRRLDRAFEDEGHGWRRCPARSATPALALRPAAAGRCRPANSPRWRPGSRSAPRLLEAVLRRPLRPAAPAGRGAACRPRWSIANPAFLRALPRATGRDGRRAAAAPLCGGPAARPGRAWRVLADRTAGARRPRPARARTARLLARVMPEAFRARAGALAAALLRSLAGRAAAPGAARARRSRRRAADARHPQRRAGSRTCLLSRELSCALVECGDLTVRGGVLYLKTLRGLQRVDVLLRRQDGRSARPAGIDADAGGAACPGCWMRRAAARCACVNAPGAGWRRRPRSPPSCRRLAPRLLGRRLLLPAVETLWLGDAGGARPGGGASPPLAGARAALDGTRPRSARRLTAEARARWPRAPGAPPPTARSRRRRPSVVPCAGGEGLTPRP